ncbi:hypothetical protein YC2023_090817 [Brassica napus]
MHKSNRSTTLFGVVQSIDSKLPCTLIDQPVVCRFQSIDASLLVDGFASSWDQGIGRSVDPSLPWNVIDRSPAIPCTPTASNHHGNPLKSLQNKTWEERDDEDNDVGDSGDEFNIETQAE